MKECYVLGYKCYDDKDTKEKMIRIIITVESIDSKYYGKMPVPVYMKWSNDLEKNLMKTIDENDCINYETEENILTGKTRVSKLNFD